MISVGKIPTFAFCHLVISGVSMSCCHWLVLEPPVKAISTQLDDWVSPGTDCCFAALLLDAVGALVCSAPSNVILGLSLWTEPGAASLLCQGAKILAGILQGTGPMPGWFTDKPLLSGISSFREVSFYNFVEGIFWPFK